MTDWLNEVITYNRSIPLGAVYDDQIVFAQMHDLFDNFVTVGATHEEWVTRFGLADKSFHIDVDRTKMGKDWKIASSQQFSNLLKGMPKRKFILYSPLDPPYPVNPLTYIMNSPTIAHAYEHKRYFRDEFSELINMPEYTVHRIDELSKTMFKELKDQFGKFVIQDVESSGSKGTFIITTEAQYLQAVEDLRKNSYSGTVVVSKFIKGEPYSVQVCVSKYGIFTGGLQRQLVDSKYLCNLGLASVTRWCGGELGGEYPEIVKHRTQEIATIVGNELASHGYKGIFGIDLLVTPENDVFSIEINARLTGYTQILSDMQLAKGKIPFILLHTLELGNFKYEVDDLDAIPGMYSLDEKYSYLILNNLTDGNFKLEKDILNGLYRIDKGGAVSYVRPSYSVADLKDDRYVLIFSKYSKGETVQRGKRILKITRKGSSIAGNGDLDPKSQRLIKAIKQEFSIPG